jgi:hypothetical protein
LLAKAICSIGPLTFEIPMLVFFIVPYMYFDAPYRSKISKIITWSSIYYIVMSTLKRKRKRKRTRGPK